jgi:hypothetical protein
MKRKFTLVFFSVCTGRVWNSTLSNFRPVPLAYYLPASSHFRPVPLAYYLLTGLKPGVNQQPPMHQLRMSPFNPFCGWTSSLPVEIFFFTSSLPRNSLPPPSYLPPPTFHLPSPPPLLPPPSYLPPTNPTPPSLHRQSSRDLERLWSGSWSGWSWSGTHAPTKR